jgi:hypothetical protein
MTKEIKSLIDEIANKNGRKCYYEKKNFKDSLCYIIFGELYKKLWFDKELDNEIVVYVADKVEREYNFWNWEWWYTLEMYDEYWDCVLYD